MGEIGDIYYTYEIPLKSFLSIKYWNLPEPRRQPIIVILPEKAGWFCVDFMQRKDGKNFEPGWDVDILNGLDRITISPSINVEKFWHGHLTNGILQ